jgi:hypothetical protein
MKVRLSILLAFVALTAIPVLAQKNYDKPVSKYGKDEALGIVQDSPWAKTYQSTAGSAGSDASAVAREQGQSATRGGSDTRSVARDFGPAPVTMRLHSSEVLRKATVRLQQLAVEYDKMSDEDKAKYDASRKTFMDCAICKDYYVITITKAPFTKGGGVDEGIFQGMTMDDMRGNIKLVNDAGEERELAQFTPPKGAGDSAVFFFKRADANGKLLITPETKDFKFVFNNTFLDARNRFANLVPRNFEFKVSKLMVGDKLMF